MDFDKFKSVFETHLNNINIKLENRQQEDFFKYMNLLIEWNKKINLTAIIKPEDIILKHFVDSLTILNEIENNTRLIDIGTGAGFPGIPLKIVNDSLDITLLDSVNKKLLFLNDVIDKLELKNIRTVHGRTEDLAHNKMYREKFDCCTSRAVAQMNVLAEYMLPFVKVKGKCICMKGLEIEEEINNSRNALSTLGGKIKEVKNLSLSNNGDNRNVIIVDKIFGTPTNYPRKAGICRKEPL